MVMGHNTHWLTATIASSAAALATHCASAQTATTSMVAQSASGQTAVASSPEPQDSEQGTGQLQEVLVTAEKRAESVLDVPASITAITSSSLDKLGIDSISDLADFVPGMSVTSGGAPGYRLIEIRGLSTNYYPTSGPLVGTYVDDLPVGDSTNNARGALFGLDLNPYDLERVEVLKGPQGTLYGANTMGGLVKYSLRSPDLHNFEFQAGVDGGYTDNAGGANRAVRAAVSLPIISGTLALRVSGFYKHMAGYINNVGLNQSGINSSKEDGGRATLLWKPLENVSIKATALAQDVDAKNVSVVTLNGATFQPVFGYNTVSAAFEQPLRQHTRVYGLSIDWHLPFATLTSATGWSRLTTDQQGDFSVAYGPYAGPGTRAPSLLALRVSKLVEEVRLTSKSNERVEWMVGGYFTKEDTFGTQYVPAYSPSYVLEPQNLLYYSEGPAGYKEPAAFGNLTYQITRRFDVSGGVRYSEYTETTGPSFGTGILNGGPLYTSVTGLPNQRVVLWMTNSRFRINDDAMLYARIATGYRPGEGCPNPACGTPPGYTPFISGIVKPDRTTDYEVGVKGSALGRSAQWDLSVFHIDWRSIQYTEVLPIGLYPVNGNTAVSNGFEFSAAYLPIKTLQLGMTLAYTDAHLTRNTPPGFNPQPDGVAGNSLPGSPRWTGSFTVDYRTPLRDSIEALFGASYHYKDAVVNQFENTGEPLPEGPQNIADAYAGAEIRDVTLKVSGSNLFNNRSYSGLLYAEDPTKPLFVPVQPRTVSLILDYQFQP